MKNYERTSRLRFLDKNGTKVLQQRYVDTYNLGESKWEDVPTEAADQTADAPAFVGFDVGKEADFTAMQVSPCTCADGPRPWHWHATGGDVVEWRLFLRILDSVGIRPYGPSLIEQSIRDRLEPADTDIHEEVFKITDRLAELDEEKT